MVSVKSRSYSSYSRCNGRRSYSSRSGNPVVAVVTVVVVDIVVAVVVVVSS